MFTERTLRKLVFGLVWFGLVICKELAKKQNVIKRKKSQDTKFCKWRGKLYLHTAGADRSLQPASLSGINIQVSLCSQHKPHFQKM